MNTLSPNLVAVPPTSASIAAQTQQLLDGKTKPRRSLGRLEDVACQIAAITGQSVPPIPDKAIIVLVADHGVADEGVSAYPAEVTRQMLMNFARGGAAINVLARQAGARLVVVDMGVRAPLLPADGAAAVISRRIRSGTGNFVHEAAMTHSQAIAAIDVGVALAREQIASGVGLLGIGEMGIGNTTSASALVAALLRAPVAEVTGRGTGVDAEGWARKVAAIEAGLKRHAPDPADALAVLAALGGLEIAGLVGVVLGAAAGRIPVVMDGFIASTAALVATRLAPEVSGYLIASHRSVEVGHRLVLDQLKQRPLLDLDLRLGEGSGAALAMPLIDSALHILHDMATFESAGVTDAGR